MADRARDQRISLHTMLGVAMVSGFGSDVEAYQGPRGLREDLTETSTGLQKAIEELCKPSRRDLSPIFFSASVYVYSSLLYVGSNTSISSLHRPPKYMRNTTPVT